MTSALASPALQARSRRARKWMLGGLRSSFFPKASPSFLIVGTMKGGTTSLFTYLSEHPQIITPFRKEIRYFDQEFHRGGGWYEQWFPTTVEVKTWQILRAKGVITGEASPSYMFIPAAAPRIREALPNVKLIALLRNPVDRARSHYMHNVRAGREPLEFGEAVRQEEDRIQRNEMPVDDWSRGVSFANLYYSYFRRGLYAEQLERLYSIFPRAQILVLLSERLFEEPQESFDVVTDFLEVDRYKLKDATPKNVGHYVSDGANLDELYERYRMPNAQLSKLIDRDLDW